MDAPTWQDWVDATTQVAEATETDFPMVMDRSGHRFAGPAISMGADYFTEEGFPTVTDDGFENMAEMFVNWHEEGVMPMDVWAGATGYAAPNEEFINARAVFYMSGSWQIGQFAEQIGDAFDWEAVPNPCGPAACTGIPGGASLVAINDTEHPEAVARVLNYLAQEDVASEFYRRTLFLPAHATVAETGVDYDTELDQVSTSLNVFGSQVSQLSDLAFRFQGYTYNRAIMNATTDRLTQALVGEHLAVAPRGQHQHVVVVGHGICVASSAAPSRARLLDGADRRPHTRRPRQPSRRPSPHVCGPPGVALPVLVLLPLVSLVVPVVLPGEPEVLAGEPEVLPCERCERAASSVCERPKA